MAGPFMGAVVLLRSVPRGPPAPDVGRRGLHAGGAGLHLRRCGPPGPACRRLVRRRSSPARPLN